MNAKLKNDLEKYTHLKLNIIKALNKNKLEEALDYAYIASSYAWQGYLGILCDEELEHLLSRISERIKEKRVVKYKGIQGTQQDVKSIVYVASFLSDVGGHSETLRQWVEMLADLFDIHCIYITNVANYPTEYSYLDDFRNKGIRIRQLSCNDSYVNRIENLIEYFEKDSPDIAILYINPNDVIAVATLLALLNRPYVIFYNHADFGFWLGKTIIDQLVEYRHESVKYSLAFRKINKVCVIPHTTNIEPQKISETFYCLPENSTLSVSAGSFHKLTGDSEWNYFRTIEKILERFPNHCHLLITNPPSQKVLAEHLSTKPDVRRRFIIEGLLPNLAPIYGGADFLIETFPCFGGRIRVEAMVCGLPIVAIRNKRFSLFSETDALPPDYPFVGSTEEEVVKHSAEFIRSPKLRKQVGKWLYRYYTQKMSQEKIRGLLGDVIKKRICCGGDASTEVQSRRIKLNYDVMYIHSVWSNYPLNRYLFFQSIMKQSEFSFKDRFKFYIECVKNQEFSKKELFGLLILTLGWRSGVFLKPLFSR